MTKQIVTVQVELRDLSNSKKFKDFLDKIPGEKEQGVTNGIFGLYLVSLLYQEGSGSGYTWADSYLRALNKREYLEPRVEVSFEMDDKFNMNSFMSLTCKVLWSNPPVYFPIYFSVDEVCLKNKRYEEAKEEDYDDLVEKYPEDFQSI